MKFWIANKEYTGSLSPSSIRSFRERTDKCMIGKVREVRVAYSKCLSFEMGNEEISASMARILDYVDLAYLIHSLVVETSPHITIDEIDDALFHCGDVAKESTNNGKNEGYTYVMVNLCNLISKEFGVLDSKKK